MVRVNGNKFKIYELDDLESFENRLSYQMETLGKYLYFENDVKETDIFNKKNNIIVENILDTIKNSALNNDSVMDLIKNIRYKVGDEKFDKSKQAYSPPAHFCSFYNACRKFISFTCH